MRRMKAGGGWPAIRYTYRKAREAGGLLRFYRALRSKNACKTCALGMGGQLGGMVNERGRRFEVCKKSIQAMAADMRGQIHEHFFDDFSIEKLRGFSSRELEAAGRLTEPLYKGPLDTHYRKIEWDDAFNRIAGKLKQTAPDHAFFYFSGRSSNEAGFLLQLFARLYGTNHVNNCSYYCHQASGVGLTLVTGSGTATVVLEDIEKSDLLFLIGANPASNHPRLMKSIIELRRRGGRVIVINPLRELGLERFNVPSDWRSLIFGSKIADEYLQPHIGGDIALMTGIAKAIIERGAADEQFVRNHAEDWDAFCEQVERTPWEKIVRDSGIARAGIERVATMYAASQRTIFCWAMGMTHHAHGVANVQMIGNLALMRGMLGKPGAGLLPLRGHSNVQGIGSMGVTPALKDAVFERLQSTFNITLPTMTGLDTLGCMIRAHEGAMKFACCLGGNLFGSNPDATFAAEAMNRIDMTVYLSTTLNTGHAWGTGRETIILPVLARDEEHQPTTQESMFNYVRLSEGAPPTRKAETPKAETPKSDAPKPSEAGGLQSAWNRRANTETPKPRGGIKPRYVGPRSEVDVIASIAQAYFGERAVPIDWQSMRRHGRIREAIAQIIPGYEAIGEIDRTKREFQIAGRTFHEPRFATPNGRARFHAIELPPLIGDGEQTLRLMTIRSEGQFNTVVYEDEDIYRGQDRRDVILMNESDIVRLGLKIDQRVTVRSETGGLSNVLVRTIDIPPGNAAMYYPEANALIPKIADDRSRTPAFKSVAVTIEATPSTEATSATATAGSR